MILNKVEISRSVKAAVGSSIIITSASDNKDLAISIICCCPTDSDSTGLSRLILTFKSSNTFRACFFISLVFKNPTLFVISLPMNKFSTTVISGHTFIS